MLYSPFYQPEYNQTYIPEKITITEYGEAQTYFLLNPDFFLLVSMILVTIFTSSLFSALTVLLIYKISRYFTKNEKHRILITVAYGLGTNALAYAVVFYVHVLGTFFSFLAFYLLFKAKQEKIKDNKYFIIAGLSAGFAILCDYNSIIIFIICLLYSLLTFKNSKKYLFLLGGVIGVLPLLFYNYSILQNPFDLVYLHTDPKIRTDVQNLFGFLNINPFILYRINFGLYRGFFIYNTILLLSFIGLYHMYKKFKIESILILIAFILFVIIYSTRITGWDGGTSFGQRYFLPIVPFLIIPLIYFLNKSNLKMKKIFLVFFIISIFINLLGLENWEWMVGEKYSVLMRQDLIKKSSTTFNVIANPILDHYIPFFMRYGLSSKLLEGHLDIRVSYITGMFSISGFIVLAILIFLF